MFNARSPLVALLLGSAFCSIALTTANAQSQPAPEVPDNDAPAPFGARGSIAFDHLLEYNLATGSFGLIGFSIGHTRYTGGGERTTERRNIAFAPSADWFPVRNLSLGLGASIGYSQMDDGPSTGPKKTSDGTILSARPRVGYVVPLTEELSLWPRVSIGYQHASHSERLGGSWTQIPHGLTTGWMASIGLPLIVTPGRNLFFTVGPELRYASTKVDNLVGPDGNPTTVSYKGLELTMVGGIGLVFGR